MATIPNTPSTPFARSAVNGMIIPLLPHQGGMLHRFNQPENRLVVASTSEPAAEEGKLVIEGGTDPALTQALEANKALQTQMSEQSQQLAAMQAQMAEFMAAQAAPKHKAPKKEAAPVVEPANAPVATPAQAELTLPTL